MKEKIGKYASQALGFVAFVAVMYALFPDETGDWLDPPNRPEDCDWFCMFIHDNFSLDNFKAIAAMTFAALKVGLAMLIAAAAFVGIRSGIRRLFEMLSSDLELETLDGQRTNDDSHSPDGDQHLDS